MQATMQPPQYVPYGPGLASVATPVPTILSTVIPQHEINFTPRQRRTWTILSGLQIAIGISCVIIYILQISAAPKAAYIAFVDPIGSPLWSGALYIIAGSLGVAAIRQNRLCLMRASMIFSILSSVTLWVVIGYAALTLVITVIDERISCNYNRDFYTGPCIIYNYKGYKAADSIMIILAVTEFIVSIWCSVLCCKVVPKACCLGCCYGGNYGYPAQMVYNPVNSAGQHVVVVQQSGVAGGQVMNASPNQPFYVDVQLPVHFAHSTAAFVAAVPPSHHPGVAWQPEFPAAHMGYVSAGSTDCGRRG